MADESIPNDPVQKFRKLISSFIPLSRPPRVEAQEAPKEEAEIKEEAKAPPTEKNKQILSALPKKSAKKDLPPPTAPKPQPAPKPTPAPAPSKQVVAALPKREAKPKPTPTPAPKPILVPAPTQAPKGESAKETKVPAWGPRLWTTASAITLGVNVVLIIILIILIISVYRLKLDMAKLTDVGLSVIDLPAGLFSNFEKMERANIETNVVVDAVIPVKFDLELNQQTDVVLSQDVTIMNALVTVNTGGLNITRANTTIVLPAGTTLPVYLSLTVPVDKQVPVTLNVPVNIPLKETQLREPFVGLQNVIKPLYCLLSPKAVNMDGVPVCQ
ncbi:MAG: hypothetical protein LC099_06955 [Anaerolineales bacterium]|nr:hypothetical protein [Anaerolineales bacterium]